MSVSQARDILQQVLAWLQQGLVGPHRHTQAKAGAVITDTPILHRNALQPVINTDSQMLNPNFNADLWRGQRYYNQPKKPKYANKGDLLWDGSSFWVWNGLKWIANQTAFSNQKPNLVFAGPSTGAAVAPAFRALVPADIPNLSASIITSGVLPVGNGGTGSSNFTSGSIPFSNGTTLTQDNVNLFWDNVHKRLGILKVPTVSLDIGGDISGFTLLSETGILELTSVQGALGPRFRADDGAGNLTIQTRLTGSDYFVFNLTSGNLGIHPLTFSPPTTLNVHGSFSLNAVTKTATYTMTASDFAVLANATGGAFTVTLPAANTEVGMFALVVKSDSSVNAVTVAAAGTDTIQGAASKSLSTQYAKSFLISDGVSTWYDLSIGGV